MIALNLDVLILLLYLCFENVYASAYRLECYRHIENVIIVDRITTPSR